jgi:hypothetical protein
MYLKHVKDILIDKIEEKYLKSKNYNNYNT